MKNFLIIQKEIWANAKDLRDSYKFLVQQAINDTYFDISMRERWSWRRKKGSILTIAPYSTGTVAVTNGSATVTGTGTTWTSAMVGRRIRVGSDSQSYEIKTVGSATSITLATQYDGSTSTSATYSLYQSLYKLARDFETLLTIAQQETPILLREWTRQDYDLVYPAPKTEGTVYFYVNAGLTTSAFYNTGTVAVTNESTTVTGSSTTFTSDMVGMSFRIRGDDQDYIIDGFTSTTVVTLDRVYTGPTRNGEKYDIDPAGIRQFELYYIPDDARIIPYWYYYKPRKLVYDWDVPIIYPDNFHDILVFGAKARLGLTPWDLFEKRLVELRRVDSLSDDITVMQTWWGEGHLQQLSNIEDSNPPVYM